MSISKSIGGALSYVLDLFLSRVEKSAGEYAGYITILNIGRDFTKSFIWHDEAFLST